MEVLSQRILKYRNQKPAICFLGQAGFILKTVSGAMIAIDPYLSNCCERLYGYKRLMPYLMEPAELAFDAILITHGHEDHFDVDSIADMMKPDQTLLVAPADVCASAEALQIPPERMIRIAAGESAAIDGCMLHAVFSDHGAEMPHAVGYILEVDGKRIFITGDTALRLDKVTDFLQYGPIDLMICPINGHFGNMSEQDAVRLCEKIRPRMVIPCHYWNFAEHGGDPGVFAVQIQECLPHQKYIIMAMGEIVEL